MHAGEIQAPLGTGALVQPLGKEEGPTLRAALDAPWVKPAQRLAQTVEHEVWNKAYRGLPGIPNNLHPAYGQCKHNCMISSEPQLRLGDGV